MYDEFLSNVVDATTKLRVGDTMDGRSQIGALISEDHLNKVTGFIERAVGEVCDSYIVVNSENDVMFFVPSLHILDQSLK